MMLTRRQWLFGLAAGLCGPSLPILWRLVPSVPAPSLEAVRQAMKVYPVMSPPNQYADVQKVAVYAQIETYTGQWRYAGVAGCVGQEQGLVWAEKLDIAVRSAHGLMADFCQQGVWEEGNQRIPFRAIRLLTA